MRLTIITVGKKHDEAIAEAINDYSKRLSHYATIEWQILKTSDINSESTKILSLIKSEDFCLLLDDQGKSLTSPQLAEVIKKEEGQGRKRLVVIIGGAYGFTEAVVKRANLVWSLSGLTFPHQLVRLLVAEQLYRAYTIIKGEKYHHD